MRATTLMVQGTASSVGKSLIATALCRLLRRRGLRVAPFKAQNMALNAAVTPLGAEIGRAQAVQAEAAGILAHADMNPVLLKPEGERRSQVVVLGRSRGSMDAVAYHAYKPELRQVICDALARLRTQVDVVVIEGAGSPAEVNLREHDIVNMFVARSARAPVLLVGDIDRGGVFAAFVGTMALLPPAERALVAGFVINKFRGDLSLLTSGLEFLQNHTGKPVLGVVPHVANLRIADEDSLALQGRPRRASPSGEALDIAVIRLPRLANHDDVLALEHEPDVRVRFAEHPDDLGGADLVILPGSKNTVADLAWLHAQGFATVLGQRAAARRPILGLCGGCQMLGRAVHDPHGMESDLQSGEGLGLLPFVTELQRHKCTAVVRGHAATPSFLTPLGAAQLEGYEIHLGTLQPLPGWQPALQLTSRNGQRVETADGAVAGDGAVVGTLVHGLFDNEPLRHAMLARLWERRGVAPPPRRPLPSKQAEYDRLADAVDGAMPWTRLEPLLAAQALEGHASA